MPKLVKSWKVPKFGIYNNNDIYSGDKVIVKADTLLQKVKSDKNGLAQITLDLPFGKYYVKNFKLQLAMYHPMKSWNLMPATRDRM